MSRFFVRSVVRSRCCSARAAAASCPAACSRASGARRARYLHAARGHQAVGREVTT